MKSTYTWCCCNGEVSNRYEACLCEHYMGRDPSSSESAFACGGMLFFLSPLFSIIYLCYSVVKYLEMKMMINPKRGVHRCVVCSTNTTARRQANHVEFKKEFKYYNSILKFPLSVNVEVTYLNNLWNHRAIITENPIATRTSTFILFKQ